MIMSYEQTHLMSSGWAWGPRATPSCEAALYRFLAQIFGFDEGIGAGTLNWEESSGLRYVRFHQCYHDVMDHYLI